MASFEFPGAYYEIIRQDMRRIDEETKFLSELLPAAGRVLDMGCGTGTNLRALSEHGFCGTGVDPSASFIARARQAAGPGGAEYVNAPFAEFATSERFDLVMCVFATLNLLPPDQLPAFFAAARDWLRPGGRLVIDAAHLLNFVESYRLVTTTKHRSGEVLVTRIASTSIHPHDAIWRTEETLVVREGGSIVAVCENSFDQWVLTAPELRRELRRAGFSLTAEYGGWGMAPAAGRGPLIQVATRAS
jgi:SAM-dependent methyltransferase